MEDWKMKKHLFSVSSVFSVVMFLIFVSAFCVPHSAFSAIPQLMNYQGKLTDADGKLVSDGNYDMIFSIYDAATEGTQEWTETWDTVTSQVEVTNGLFNVLLGSQSSLDIAFDEDYWLEIQVKYGESYETLAPRQRIVSSGYAYRAEKVTDGAITNLSISDTAEIADTKLATISTAGKVSGEAVSGGTLGAVDGSGITNISGGNIAEGTVSAGALAESYLLDSGDTATGDYTFDTTTLHVDSTNDRVGIGTTSPSAKLGVLQAGADSGIYINQTGNGIPLQIVNTGNQNSIYATSQFGLNIIQSAADGTGLFVTRNIDDAETYPLVQFTSDHASNTQPVLKIKQDGTGSGLIVDGAGTGYSAIFNNGNVGIGTTVPEGLLDLKIQSTVPEIKFQSISNNYDGALSAYDGGGNGVLLFLGSNAYVNAGNPDRFNDGLGGSGVMVYDEEVRLYTSSSTQDPQERVRILSNGNVGIGTTSPDEKLEIYNGNIKIGDDENEARHLYFSRNGVAIGEISTSNSDFYISSADGEDIQFADVTRMGNDQPFMVIKSVSGNVGIGTTSPESKVHVYRSASTADLKIETDGAGSSAYLNLDREDTNRRTMVRYQTDGSTDWGTGIAYTGSETYDYHIATGINIADAKLTVTTAGNVGIGTTSPTATLHTVQTATTGNTGWFYRSLASASTDSPVMFIEQDNSNDDQPALRIQQDGATLSLDIDDNSDSAGGVNINMGGTGAGLTVDGVGTGYSAIFNNGNVGIGTTGPSGMLHINAAESAGNTDMLHFGRGSGYGQTYFNQYYNSGSDYGLYIGSTSAAGGVKVTINHNSGNVGIGTTSPTSKLQVVGLSEYADNTAASAAGLTAGALYRTGDLLKVVH